MYSRTKLSVAPLLELLAALGVVGVAAAAVPTDSSKLRGAVDAAGIMKHENEFRKSPTRTTAHGRPAHLSPRSFLAPQRSDVG